MMKSQKMTVSISLLILVVCSTTALDYAVGQESTGKVSFGTLLEELTNRENLALHPMGLWTQHQVSSYDRRSVNPKDSNGWYANNDWNHFIRKEVNDGRNEFVLLDVDGPGVVTRFWNAGNPNLKAALRFYIDGESTPFWEADHSGALVGENKHIGRPLSSRSVEQDQLPMNPGARPGHNLYAPIPFSKHMKITYEGPAKRPGAGNGMFYNINYRLYKKNTIVESFSKTTVEQYADVLRKANQRLSDFMYLKPAEARVAGEKSVQQISAIVPAGKTLSEQVGKGEGAIRRLHLFVEKGDLNKAIQDLWIHLSFDGVTNCAVPVGFFFGCGDQLVSSSDWYRKVDDDGNMACFWVMPFQKDAVVGLENKGEQDLRVNLVVGKSDWKWTKDSMYFHGKYSRLDGFETRAKTGKDFSYLTLNTAGAYVGDTLQIKKAMGGWWGEGDEKIYIDGSDFPDHFGTGTEDYFGYAWGHPETFSHPFVGQPIGNANLLKKGGVTVNSRLRSLDSIPFEKSLKFDMESWNWHGGKVDFAWVCFWYERPE